MKVVTQMAGTRVPIGSRASESSSSSNSVSFEDTFSYLKTVSNTGVNFAGWSFTSGGFTDTTSTRTSSSTYSGSWQTIGVSRITSVSSSSAGSFEYGYTKSDSHSNIYDGFTGTGSRTFTLKETRDYSASGSTLVSASPSATVSEFAYVQMDGKLERSYAGQTEDGWTQVDTFFSTSTSGSDIVTEGTVEVVFDSAQNGITTTLSTSGATTGPTVVDQTTSSMSAVRWVSVTSSTTAEASQITTTLNSAGDPTTAQTTTASTQLFIEGSSESTSMMVVTDGASATRPAWAEVVKRSVSVAEEGEQLWRISGSGIGRVTGLGESAAEVSASSEPATAVVAVTAVSPFAAASTVTTTATGVVFTNDMVSYSTQTREVRSSPQSVIPHQSSSQEIVRVSAVSLSMSTVPITNAVVFMTSRSVAQISSSTTGTDTFSLVNDGLSQVAKITGTITTTSSVSNGPVKFTESTSVITGTMIAAGFSSSTSSMTSEHGQSYVGSHVETVFPSLASSVVISQVGGALAVGEMLRSGYGLGDVGQSAVDGSMGWGVGGASLTIPDGVWSVWAQLSRKVPIRYPGVVTSALPWLGITFSVSRSEDSVSVATRNASTTGSSSGVLALLGTVARSSSVLPTHAGYGGLPSGATVGLLPGVYRTVDLSGGSSGWSTVSAATTINAGSLHVSDGGGISVVNIWATEGIGVPFVVVTSQGHTNPGYIGS